MHAGKQKQPQIRPKRSFQQNSMYPVTIEELIIM
jgi:hypothetical protein